MLFNLSKPVVKKLPIINKKILSKFLKDQIAFSDTAETVRQALGLTSPISDGFTDLDKIKKQRGLVGRLIRRFKTKKGKRQAVIDLFTLGRGMFAASSKIGDGTFKIVNHRDGTRSVVKRSKAEIAKIDTKFTQRYQVFENNKDFFEQIVSDYDGEIEYKLDGKGALIELTIDGKKVTDTELSLYDEKTNSVIDKNGELIKDIPYTERKAQSKRAQDFIKNIIARLESFNFTRSDAVHD